MILKSVQISLTNFLITNLINLSLLVNMDMQGSPL